MNNPFKERWEVQEGRITKHIPLDINWKPLWFNILLFCVVLSFLAYSLVSGWAPTDPHMKISQPALLFIVSLMCFLFLVGVSTIAWPSFNYHYPEYTHIHEIKMKNASNTIYDEALDDLIAELKINSEEVRLNEWREIFRGLNEEIALMEKESFVQIKPERKDYVGYLKEANGRK